MIAPFRQMQEIWSSHFRADRFEQIERAKGVARALHKQHWRLQFAQHRISQFGPVTAAAQGVSETNESRDFLFQRDMTPDSTAHAFADQKNGSGPA